MRVFGWSCLYHFMGRDERALEGLRHAALDMDTKEPCHAIEHVAETLRRFIEAEIAQKHSGQEILQELMQALSERILRKELPLVGLISREPERRQASHSAMNNHDRSPLNSRFSRDPFIPLVDSEEGPSVVLGAVAYLLRSYSRVFGKPPLERHIQSAKQSLNDCFQSFQFLWRLYMTSAGTHSRSNGSPPDFHTQILTEIRGSKVLPNSDDYSVPSIEPHSSSFFIWQMLILVEIMRGNIYYHSGFSVNAKYFYSEALKRSSRFRHESRRAHPQKENELWPIYNSLATPTIIRARFERSKLYFDEGNLLQSLVEQLKCLRSIVTAEQEQLKSYDKQTDLPKLVREKQIQLEELHTTYSFAIKRLTIEQHAPTWDKHFICSLFDFNNPDYRDSLHEKYKDKVKALFNSLERTNAIWGSSHVICPDTILAPFYNPESDATIETSLSDRDQKFISEILARIAFTLLTLRVETMDGLLLTSGFVKHWLGSLLTPDNKRISESNRSWMARYCQTIVNTPDSGPVAGPGASASQVFPHNLERQLAFRLRQAIKVQSDFSSDDSKTYISLLNATTQNIGNLVTIPRKNHEILTRSGYIQYRKEGDPLSGPEDKLVVLRRWQSYNPKLPRPDSHRLRGGGYLLLWKGKGIAIDPGYDFIQNLYEEGFSLADINAVIVSHSHPDHDDDLSTLLTMYHEWNDLQKQSGRKARKIDLFLNESSLRKFSTWVHSDSTVIGRIVPLPLVVWDKSSKSPVVDRGESQEVGPRRGENVQINLCGPDGYCMFIEVVPAWHNDVLDNTGAAGFVFHLCNNSDTPQSSADAICRVGYTGDTAAYGISPEVNGNVSEQYRECDVIVVHLGDARLREIATLIASSDTGARAPIPMLDVLRDCFCKQMGSDRWKLIPSRVTKDRVKDILHLLSALDLIHSSLYEFTFSHPQKSGKVITSTLPAFVSTWLDEGGESALRALDYTSMRDIAFELLKLRDWGIASEYIIKGLAEICPPQEKTEQIEYTIYFCLLLLSCSCHVPWTYENHLGIKGMEHLFRSILHYRTSVLWDRDHSRALHGSIFVVGELPEELSSYRHRIARWLNTDIVNQVLGDRDDDRRCAIPRAITGDIGLHIRLAKGKEYQPMVRCDFCNFNNETSDARKAYHPISEISETPVKALDSRIVYLCRKKDHHVPDATGAYLHYLYRPEVKRI